VRDKLIAEGTYPSLDQHVPEDEFDFTAPNAGEGEGDPLLLPAREKATPEATAPEDMALNGAQITAIKGIVEAVGLRTLPPETAVELIQVGFPSISETKARAIIEPMRGFEAAIPGPPQAQPSESDA
jgi:hypothetical protein